MPAPHGLGDHESPSERKAIHDGRCSCQNGRVGRPDGDRHRCLRRRARRLAAHPPARRGVDQHARRVSEPRSNAQCTPPRRYCRSRPRWSPAPAAPATRRSSRARADRRATRATHAHPGRVRRSRPRTGGPHSPHVTNSPSARRRAATSGGGTFVAAMSGTGSMGQALPRAASCLPRYVITSCGAPRATRASALLRLARRARSRRGRAGRPEDSLPGAPPAADRLRFPAPRIEDSQTLRHSIALSIENLSTACP